MARLILGHCTENSIKIWVRGSSRWPVAFIDVLDESGIPMGETKTLETIDSEFYTAVIEWKLLQPDSAYRVKVAFGKTRASKPGDRIREAYTEGRFRTFPAANSITSFSFIFGSCNLHSLGILERPDRAWVEISKVAKESSARFMIHCGDQIYSDIPFKPSVDIQHFREKYLDAWEDCIPARRVLTELPHYMILDDHELINNFDTAGGSATQPLARVAIKAYWEFQHSHNPASRHEDHHYHYDFSYGAVRFFVMDTRYYRNSMEGRMLDETQEADFMRWLVRYRDDMKFVVTSVPFIGVVKSSEGDKWSDNAFQDQRGRILRKIIDAKVSRLVFLTGDMHTSYHATMEVSDGSNAIVLHELMSSPINQFTPNIKASKIYEMDDSRTLTNGIKTRARIMPKSFYGKHSNIMVVDVKDDISGFVVGYRILRTTKSDTGPSGSFTP